MDQLLLLYSKITLIQENFRADPYFAEVFLSDLLLRLSELCSYKICYPEYYNLQLSFEYLGTESPITTARDGAQSQLCWIMKQHLIDQNNDSNSYISVLPNHIFQQLTNFFDVVVKN